MVLTMLTQVIMLLKTSVVASNFGISVEMDAFNFANNIGTFIYSFIGAGVTTVLIPNLINTKNKESINIFISILYTTALAILFIIFSIKEDIIKILFRGSDEFIMLTNNIMVITLITQFINSFTGVTNAITQCSGKFNLPKISTLVTSIILLLSIVFINDLTIYTYAFIILITTILNVAFQVYIVIRDRYVFKYKINIRDKKFKNMMKVFAPTVLGAGLYQISLLMDGIISANLGPGEISKLSYSNTIMGMVNSVIISNITTYFYPQIARDADEENGGEKLFDLILLVNAIMILIVVGFILVGKDGIVILYERGEFTSSVTEVVYLCTLVYIFGLPANAFRDFIYRYFYAKGDTMTPFKNGLIISCLNIVISIILSKQMGIYGIIFGTTFTSYLSLILILMKFHKRYKFNYNIKIFILENIKLIIAAIITILVINIVIKLTLNINIFIKCIICGISAVIIYCIIAYILKSKIFILKLNN